jgi:uncharacterized protein YlxP (DUF503 family)
MKYAQHHRLTSQTLDPGQRAGVSPAGRWRAMAAGISLILGAGGCAAPTAPPHRNVYVNLQALAIQRGEWQAVTQLNQLMGQLLASASAPQRVLSGRSAPPKQAAVPPFEPIAAPPVNLRTASLEAAVRASTPSSAEIRAELERETEGELALYRRTAQQRRLGPLEGQIHALQDQYADLRRAIIQDFVYQITNLKLKRSVLQTWLQQGQPTSLDPVPIQAFYTQTQKQIMDINAALDALLAQEAEAVQANRAKLRALITALRTRFAANVDADIVRHEAENRKWVDDQILAAEQDAREEAAQRRALFEQIRLQHPLAYRVPMAAPASPQPPSPRIIGETIPGASSTYSSQTAAQIADLKQQRDKLAASVLTDTRSWAEAVASRQNWTVHWTPQAGLIDETRQLGDWWKASVIPAG